MLTDEQIEVFFEKLSLLIDEGWSLDCALGMLKMYRYSKTSKFKFMSDNPKYIAISEKYKSKRQALLDKKKAFHSGPLNEQTIDT